MNPVFWILIFVFALAFSEGTIVPKTFTILPTKGKVRKDYDINVAQTLQLLGWQRIQAQNLTNSPTHLFWSLHFEDNRQYVAYNFSENQIINSIPDLGPHILGKKNHLINLCKQSRYIPQTFLASNFNPNEPGLWIQKPLNSWSGRGVTLFNPSTHIPSNDFVIQQYIQGPTIQGFKFDTRWWVLLFKEPLKAFMLPESLVRIAKSKATDATKCAHVTNSEVQKSKLCKDMAKIYKTELDQLNFSGSLSPLFWDNLIFSNGSSVPKFDMTLQVKNAVIDIIKVVQDDITGFKNVTRAKCFQLLSFDFIFDDSLHPWIEEINMNGYLGSGIHKIERWGNVALKTMFETVLNELDDNTNTCAVTLEEHAVWQQIL